MANLFKFILGLFFILLLPASYAIDVVEINQKFEQEDVGSKVEIIATDQDYGTPMQIKDLKEWKDNYLDDLFISDEHDYFWARIHINNHVQKNLIFLVLENNFIDLTDAFLIDIARKRIERVWHFTGKDGLWTKPFPTPLIAAPLFLSAGTNYDLYIKIKNAHKTYVPIKIYSQTSFALNDTISKIFIGILQGVILLATIYSFMMYALIREKRFLSYGCFNLVLSLLTIYLSGYITFFNLFPSGLNVHKIYFFVSSLFYIALIISFYEMYMHLDVVRKLSRQSWIYLSYPIVMLVACWFLPTSCSIYCNIGFTAFCIISCFYVLQTKWSKTSFFQRIYGIAILLFLTCWLGNCLSRNGILYLPILSDRILYYFAIMISFSLSFGLVYRTYIERQSRIYAGHVHQHHSKRFLDMYHQANEGFFSMDLDGKLLDGNKAFFNMLGYKNMDDYRMSCGPMIHSMYTASDQSSELLSEVIFANIEDGIKREIILKRKDGTDFIALISLRLFERSENVKSNHAIEGIVVDVSENRQIKSQIDYLMNHDVVTNLHNRSFMQKRVEQLSEKFGTYKPNCHDYFLFVDIDHFKVINNSCGSTAGDSFLQLIGKTIRTVVADENVARIGGDEFGIIVTNSYVDAAISKAEEIRSLLQKLRFEWNKNYYSITASIGVILCETIDTSAILSLAETACGAAKLQGRNRVYLYSELSDDVLNYKKEIGWVAQIYKAIEQNKFILFKQRILTVSQQDGNCYEVFVRLLGDNGNILPASTFIGAAKKFGLISHIDSWVIESLHEWLCTQDLDDIESIFINMSLSSISSLHTHRKLKRLFDKANYPLEKLCFEISENSMNDPSANVRDFEKLIRSYNCQLALDHFESGLGSFALVQQVKPNYLKIDCETLISMEKLGGETVIRDLHRELKKNPLKIVIMHIKNDEQYQIVKKYDFDAYQGFGIERPLPIGLANVKDEN